MGKKDAGLLGTTTNRPVVDPGTLVVKRSSPPMHVCKRSAAKRTGRRSVAVALRNKPKAFILTRPQVKAVLPDAIWEKARERVDGLFKNAGGLMTAPIGSR